ncbi:MAG: AEC family transporter [Proteobacteria bacterium]|nr:AEC family transporter [Pseudomonadota bacterium]
MQTIIEILLPIIGFIACGYGAGRFRWINEDGIKGIMTFVLYFAIPALLFRIVVNNELPGVEDLNVLLAYYGGCFIVFAASVLFGRVVFKLPLDQLGILGMGAMYSNSVLLGLPLVFTMFGEDGMIPVLLIITFHSVFLFPVVIIFIEIGRGRRDASRRGSGAVLMSAFRGTIENPVIFALAFSFVWALAGLGLPGPLDIFAELMGKAVAPSALFALGASLAGYRIAGALAESLTMVGFKLFVHPAAVWLLGRYVFDLDPVVLAAATIMAAVPIGANVFIIAHKYEVYLARVTSAVVISAAVSVVTLAVLLPLLVP